jgi:hypothetical protein
MDVCIAGGRAKAGKLFRGYVVENPLHLSDNIITVFFTRAGEIFVNMNVSRKLFKRQCYARYVCCAMQENSR